MHELTIAQNIIDIITQSLSGDQFKEAESVKIKLGLFSNVLPEALNVSFDVLKKRHNLQNVKLEIEMVPLTIMCHNCMESVTTKELFSNCSFCSSSDIEIINGDLLEISEIILSENA